MTKSTLPVLLALIVPIVSLAQDMSDEDRDALIASAVSAAPASVTDNATIMNWDNTVLREGSNGYTCFPDMPNSPGNDPACVDATWAAFFDAWMNKTEFSTESIGISYMMAGGTPSSNTDPWGTEPTDDNEWMAEGGPHIMIVVPTAALEGMNTDPTTGAPWVMWRGTDFAHIMIPTGGH